jgi:uncharacterized BrkB/YihY/UPF0761 family membrane protein
VNTPQSKLSDTPWRLAFFWMFACLPVAYLFVALTGFSVSSAEFDSTAPALAAIIAWPLAGLTESRAPKFFRSKAKRLAI